MISAADHELLQDYLDDTLAGDARTALESRLRTEPALADAFVRLSHEEAILTEWARANQTVEVERRLKAPVRASDLQGFHLLLARLSGNPVLTLYLEGVLRLARFHSRFPALRASMSGLVEAVVEAHTRIAEAVAAGEAAQAAQELEAYLSIDPDQRV